MTAEAPTPDPASEVAAGEDHDDDHGLPPRSTIKRWLVTTNHKDIGLLYIVTSLFFLAFGGVLALLFRLQLWTPGAQVMPPDSYYQAVTGHGLIMVFFFLSPFAFGFANYIVPLQLGAKDLAFPRLNALSYWLYLCSGILFGITYFLGGSLATGWTLYAPLNGPSYAPTIGATGAVLAMIMFVASVTVSSVNFLTTMHRMRAEGMTLRKMPMFSWSILLTVWMMLFAFAALLAAFMVLAADHVLATNYFAYSINDGAQTNQGASLLWTHLFWFFGHPEVYIVFFPALGVMAEVFQTFSGRRLVGRKFFIGAMLLVALQSFVVWMHHMFLTGINLNVQTIFMATTIGISLPFDLMTFALIYTLAKGRIRYTTPFLFCLGALVLFILGGITGVFLGAIPLDYELRGTYWVVAHFHYVMVSGVTALIGGLYYWWPKMTGTMYDERLGWLHFGLYFVGFNLLYFPMFLAWETPRRDFVYPEAFTTWQQLATVGAFILGGSFLIMAYNLTTSLLEDTDVEDNPWSGWALEWSVPSPPPLDNFPGMPTLADDSLSFTEGVTDGAGAVAHDEDHEEAHADHASWWPLIISVTGFLFLLGLSGFQVGREGGPLGSPGMAYQVLAVLGGVGLGGSILGIARESFHAPEMAVGERWPFAGVENTKLGVWIFLASDVVLFGAFISAYLFTRVANGWNDWFIVPGDPIPGLMNTYILLTSSFTVVLALVAAEKESTWGLVASLSTTLILGLGFLGNKAIEWQHLLDEGGPDHGGIWIDSTIESSMFFLTTGLHAAHVIVGLAIAAYLIVRAWNGAYLEDDGPVEYFGLYWHFVDIVWLFLFPLFYLPLNI